MHDSIWPAVKTPSSTPSRRRPRVEQPVERPQRERDELRLLQLQVRVVIDAVRRKREDDAGEDRRAAVAGQAAHQQRDADARQREAREEHEVVDQDRRDAEPVERRGEQPGHQQRLGIRERVALGIEDVGVEDVRRRDRQLMRDPRRAPRSPSADRRDRARRRTCGRPAGRSSPRSARRTARASARGSAAVDCGGA